ncbi:peptide ABC transporter substrate-binding protein [Weissella minor]|uniref:peptide ABC transporter substrate-binding protein n=1 Tax=Weissella minor TaxID=1620 RepID=UPI001BB0538F|nr:peptide ABC transporter substrate-binding protein [Weissella minor]MBS0949678.1 peptide ABC transporter substrate-binding protein [Weissella minor]
MKKSIGKPLALAAGFMLAGTVLAQATASADEDEGKYKPITWAETAPLSSMDPSKVTAAIDFDGLTATNDGLFRADKNNKPQPALAESYEVSDDGLHYTFKLRKGAEWSNGTPITANDFVYGWQRTNDPKTASQYAYLFSGIKNADAIQNGKEKDLSKLGVKAEDDHTLKVDLEKPLPQLISMLPMAPFFPQNEAFVKEVGAKYGTQSKYILSSGPYVQEDWNGSNDTVNYKKNEKYYDKDAVKTKKLTIKTIADQNTGYNLYKSDTLDFTTLSPQQVTASKNDKAFTTIPSATASYIQLNEKQVPEFKNTNIRRAISYGIDRKILADKILTGSATPATTFSATKLVENPNDGEDFSKSVTVDGAVTHDLDKAQELFDKGLKETGSKNLEIELLADDSDGAKRSAEFLQSQLQQIKGLKVKIKMVPFKQRLSLSADKKFDMVISIWSADYADPSTFLDLYKSDSPFNEGSWHNDEYDALIKRANGEHVNDPKKRFADYKEAEQLMSKEMGVVPLYYRSNAAFVRPSVKGMVYQPAGAPYDFKWAYKE